MRRTRLSLIAATTVATFSLFSCVNQDYDLSNIDTSVRVNVDNFTVPVQVTNIKLDKVLDLDDNSEIQKINDGYAYLKEGEFKSSKITINEIKINKPVITPISDAVMINFSLPTELANAPAMFDSYSVKNLKENASLIPGFTWEDDKEIISFSIPNAESVLNFSADDIDKAVKAVKKLTTDADLKVNITLSGLEKYVNPFNVENLGLELPKGLESSNKNYTSSTGKFFVASQPVEGAKSFNIDFPISAIDYDLAKVQTPGEEGAVFDGEKHTFKYQKSCKANSGNVQILWKDIKENVTLKDLKDLAKKAETTPIISYVANIGFEKDIVIKKFSGNIYYEVGGVNIDPIKFDNLPEILQGTGTVIELANPQLYVNVTDPINNATVNPTASMELLRHPDNKTFAPENNPITIHAGENIFCFSPTKPDNMYPGYRTATHEKWTSLSTILATAEQKIPESIDVNINPLVSEDVTDFELKSYDEVTGTYTFLAPLTLTDKSQISYEKNADGWNDEDIDKIEIDLLEITADIVSKVDLQGKEIVISPIVFKTDYKNRKSSEVAKVDSSIKATATLPKGESKFNVKLTGPIRHLDGVEFKLKAAGTNGQLSPEQTISISNLKATVTGSFTSYDDK